MSFFIEGDRYQDQYLIESTMDFFDGELAIARLDDQRYYLQLAPLKKQAPPRSIRQYLALDHPLVLPYLQVFTEERALVFIRPFVEIRPLLDIVVREPMDEDRVVGWVKSLLQLELLLAKQPLSMYLLNEPQNFGLTPEGELKVIYCGVNQVTQLESTLDWGTLFYILLSGEIPDQPVAKLLSELPVSKPMEKLLQRSIKSRSINDLLSSIDTYEKRKNSKGLLGRLFRTRSHGKSVEKAEKKNTIGEKTVSRQKDLNSTIPEADSLADKKHLEGDPKPSEDKRLEAERLELERLEAERREQERLEAERLELERLEAERREQERLEAERLELERLEAERREQERLEAERLELERLEAERRERERLEAERLELERLEAERRERERLEAERLELERLEAERRERERLEAERLELERLEAERERRERERRERELARRAKEREQRNLLIRQRLQLEYEEHERLARQFEEYAKQVFYR